MGIEVFIIIGILCVPIFFLWKRILAKSRLTSFAKYLVVTAFTICSSALLYVGLVFIFFAITEYYPDKKFDSNGWQQHKDERYEYSKDVIESKMLVGKSKAQVRVLLGEEDNPNSSDMWGYQLGFRPALLEIDPDWLEIDFKNGRVTNVSQHQE